LRRCAVAPDSADIATIGDAQSSAMVTEESWPGRRRRIQRHLTEAGWGLVVS
jgi:hypothetical protein